MRNSFRTAVLLAAAAASACVPARKAPAPAPAADSTEKPMTIQEWKGQYGGPDEPGGAVANDQGAWERAWKSVGKDAPAADFDRFVGVLVFLGLRSTGGWAVVFDEPKARGDDLVVGYRALKPTGFTTQALARPWKARLFPRPKGRVLLEALSE